MKQETLHLDIAGCWGVQFVSYVCVRWWVVFPSLPPSRQQTALRVEVLKSRGEPDPSPPGWSPAASLWEGDIRRFTPCCLWNPNCGSSVEEVLEGKLDVEAGGS